MFVLFILAADQEIGIQEMVAFKILWGSNLTWAIFGGVVVEVLCDQRLFGDSSKASNEEIHN
jgi:hypothetical protein